MQRPSYCFPHPHRSCRRLFQVRTSIFLPDTLAFLEKFPSHMGSGMFRVDASPSCYGTVDGDGKLSLPFIYVGIKDYCRSHFPCLCSKMHGTALCKTSFYRMRFFRQQGISHDGNRRQERKGTILLRPQRSSRFAKWDGCFLAERQTWPGPAAALTPTWKTATEILRKRGIDTAGTAIHLIPILLAVGDFTDMKADSYFTEAILWTAENEIASNTASKIFFPDWPCTKEKIWALLYRAYGEPELYPSVFFWMSEMPIMITKHPPVRDCSQKRDCDIIRKWK